MPKSKDVDAWFARYENPMKPVVERIREIVVAADERMGECIKWQAPTFIYKGNLASFFPKSKQHASLMFHTGAQIPGKHPLLTGGGDTSRVMKIGSVAEANSSKRDIERIVKAWCDFRDRADEGTQAAKPPRSKPTRAKPNSKTAKRATKRSRSNP
jgi:uncharacterized protein YdhG (YjbR/CyaY superfamily)